MRPSDRIAIEVKAKEHVGKRDLRGLKALAEGLQRYIVISLDRQPRPQDGIEILPWQLFLERLWAGELDR